MAHIDPDDIVDIEKPVSVPDRKRRSFFVIGSWCAAFSLTWYLSASGIEGKLAETAIDGCTTYMIITMVTYLTSHSIDRADFLNSVREMMRKRGH